MDFLNTLNEEQYKAATFDKGPCLVIAGAGSGKTKVLTARIASLIGKGVYSNKILAITFTNKAANEMRQRVENLIGRHNAFVGTFHSFGLRVIKENLEALGMSSNFTIIDTEDVNAVIKKILKDMGEDPKEYSPAYIRNRISFIKNNMLSSSEIDKFFLTPPEKLAARVYTEYEKILKRNNTVDFDDLLKKPVELFKEHSDILEKYQDRFEYILIDEYQDTNDVQYKLVKLLAKGHKNLFVVGDPSQSIYAFRGANFQNILNFEKDYPDATVITLPQNYRSTQTILDAANDVIKNNSKRKDIDLFSNLGKGTKIKYIRAFNDDMETTRVLEEIKNLETEGYRKRDIAIFYRTNAQSRLMEDKLVKNNVPYKVYGSYYFYKRKEIKDLIAYLKLIANHHDDISLKRVINEPKRKIGQKTIDNLEKLAEIENTSMFDAISGGKEEEFKELILDLEKDSMSLSLTELIDKVLEKTKIKEFLEKENTLDSSLRLDNLMEFKSVTENFEKVTGSVNLNDFLEEISLVADAAEYSEDSDAVTLMTIHSAKGLEFKCVFIIGLEESILPHANSMYSEDELEEERRLMYVAITRAKERLYLLNAERRMLFGKTTSNPPSRFIGEIRSSIIDVDKKTENLKTINKKLLYDEDSSSSEEFKKGDLVKHLTFGKGIVTGVDERFVTIAFNFKIGTKKFLKNYKGIKKV